MKTRRLSLSVMLILSLFLNVLINRAPNNGLGLTEVRGWALGTVATLSLQTYYVDSAMVYGVAPIKYPVTSLLPAKQTSVSPTSD